MTPLYTQQQFDEGCYKTNLSLQCENCLCTFYKTKKEIGYFLAKKKRYSENWGRYCSSKCWGEALRKSNRKTINCKNCNKEIDLTYYRLAWSENHFCSNSCCAKFNNPNRKKKGKSKIEYWLNDQLIKKYPNLNFIFNDRKVLDGLELDIYIPSLSIGFELNGVFHYEPVFGYKQLNNQVSRDCKKAYLCMQKKINLCVIDITSLTYFKEHKCLKFLQIITDIIEGHPEFKNSSF